MDAIATFLLGGAVGVALGYLASRKKARRPMTTVPGRPVQAPPVGPPAEAEEPAPFAETVAEPVSLATAVVEAPPVEEVVVEEPPVEERAAEQPLAEELLAEELLAEEPLAEALLAEEPLARGLLVEGTPIAETVIEETVAGRAIAEPLAAEETPAEASAAAEVVVPEAPAIWEEESAEPAPAPEGWTVEIPTFPDLTGGQGPEEGAGPSAVSPVEVSEPEPLGAEALLEEAGEEEFDTVWEDHAALATAEEALAGPTAGVEEELESWEPVREETAREPEEAEGHPVVTEADIGEIEFVDLAMFETLKEEVADLEVADLEVADLEVAEQPVVGEGIAAEPESLIAPEASTQGEAVLEGPPSPVTAVPPIVSPVDDLKARIEETRRRIRRELEQPFVSVDEIEHTRDWTVSPVLPVGVVEPGPARIEPTGVTESQPEPLEPEPLEPEPAGTSAVESTSEVTPGLGTGEVLDYASMKSRIEVTRSRLKAKAFDAMMTGESALLAREPENARPTKPVLPAIDNEIDQTIETGLREQED